MGQQVTFNVSLRWIVVFTFLSACVDIIDFENGNFQSLTVIEGMINTDPGPYTVKVSTGWQGDGERPVPVTEAIVTLYDDKGNVETMHEQSPGTYLSGGVIRGEHGHAYYITVQTQDGSIFQSAADTISATGILHDITYEFEYRKAEKEFGEVDANVFNIYVNGDAGETKFVRWRFQGTYEVETHPELHLTHNPPYTPYKDPPACSGYVVDEGPEGSGGLLKQVGDCTCCFCWPSHYEEKPNVSDASFAEGGAFRHFKVGEVPVNNNTFHKKYMVEVQQMSMSATAYEYFKQVREQLENASDLFQPLPGEIRGNFNSTNSTSPVVGLFWGTSVSSKTIFIDKSAVPYNLTPIDFITEPCTIFKNASTIKPANWE